MILYQTLKKERRRGRKHRLTLTEALSRDKQRKAEKQMNRIKQELLEREERIRHLRGINL